MQLKGLGYRTPFKVQVDTLHRNAERINKVFGQVLDEDFIDAALNQGVSTHQIQETLHRIVEEEREARMVRAEALIG